MKRYLAIFGLALGLGACSTSGFNRPVEVPAPPVVTTPSGATYEDLRLGEGAEAVEGSALEVHYIGWVAGGARFDSTYDRGVPVEFTLGAGQVIRGWEEGMQGMRAGGKRRIRIPPELAYGDAGLGNVIAPGATLVLDVELLEVRGGG
jgi:FKBP-type peptidyl-prolyl cis-trans isomerase FkpA